MSDLLTSLDRLEVEFAEALEAHGDGGNLTFVLFPIDQAIETGPVRINAVSIPRDYFPGTSWAEQFGFALWTDFAGQSHQVLSYVAGTSRSAEPLQAFLRLARRAGALCFRLPRGRAQTGPGNAPELNWLGTLYSYLKGTSFVIEGPGCSRLRSVFSGSVEVLSLIHRGDESGNALPYTGSLRPGLPGVEGEVRFELTPRDASQPHPKAEDESPAPQAPPTPPSPVGTGATATASEVPETPPPAEDLKPDQFRFGTGQIVGDFTSKHLLLLRSLQRVGTGGIALGSLAKELGYEDDERGRKALGQLVSRTQEKIDGRAPYIIELVNGKYCLTCTAKSS